MQYYHFDRLIRKYSSAFTVIIPKDNIVDDYGEIVTEGSKRRQIKGAILSHRENKVYKSNGTITQQDKVLYMLKPLEKDLQGAEIVHNGKVYRIGNELENACFTGVFSYGLTYVSVFNEVEE